MKISVFLLMLLGFSYAQQPMIAYQTKDGWYLYNSDGDALINPEMLGLTGPVMGPAHGYMVVRQLHRLRADLTAETHQILMDMEGNRYLEETEVRERIRWIVDGRYAATENYDNEDFSIYHIKSGKKVVSMPLAEVSPTAVGVFTWQRYESDTVYIYSIKNGKQLKMITGVDYVTNEGDITLVKYKSGDMQMLLEKGELDEPNFGPDSIDMRPYDIVLEGEPGKLTVKDGLGNVLATNVPGEEVEQACYGHVVYRKEDKLGVCDSQGKIIVPHDGYAYSDIMLFDGFIEARGDRSKDRRNFILDYTGKEIALPDINNYYFYMPLQSSSCKKGGDQPEAIQYFIPN